LSPAFESLGFQETPTYLRHPALGFMAIPRVSTEAGRSGALQTLTTLGVKPRLVREGGTGRIFFADPSGTLRQIPNTQAFRDFGFSSDDVIQLGPGEIAALGPIGAPLTEAPPLIEPGVSERRFPQSTMPRTLEFPHGETILLPEMRKLASLWRFISTDTRKVISSALSFGGQSADEQFRERRAFTPQGSALRAGATFG
ncbi:hypothetical protein LCGC14_1842000, partial [marine sediment metagenome]